MPPLLEVRDLEVSYGRLPALQGVDLDIYPGEFVVFDSTQKNAGGDLCVWITNPKWTLQDPSGVLTLRDGQNNPFLLRTDVKKKGEMSLSATVDGVVSNVLEISAVGRP